MNYGAMQVEKCTPLHTHTHTHTICSVWCVNATNPKLSDRINQPQITVYIYIYISIVCIVVPSIKYKYGPRPNCLSIQTHITHTHHTHTQTEYASIIHEIKWQQIKTAQGRLKKE